MMHPDEATAPIFNPVVCELFYQWFTPTDAVIIDPFAGGSVRGVVASKLGRTYVGMELYREQVEANRRHAKVVCPEDPPTWFAGDSRAISGTIARCRPGVQFDAIFSSPPYFDLELCSDDKRDLSNTTWEGFLEAYADIIRQSCSLMREDRFAGFVVADIRDKEGHYRLLSHLTVECFHRAGLHLYNEIIMANAIGSLPLRPHRQFVESRVMGGHFQKLLIFVKGDWRKATEACEPSHELTKDLGLVAAPQI